MELYEIGTKYIAQGKSKDVETITDILKTYNSKNELVRIEYQVEHTFAGQNITHYVPHTTIKRAEIDGRIITKSNKLKALWSEL